MKPEHLFERDNQEQWQRLLFSLERREKTTLMIITVHNHRDRYSLHEKLVISLPQYRFHDLDLASHSVVSLQRAFEKNLPESVLNSQPAEYIVNVFELDNSSLVMTESGKIEPSGMIAELNFEREILFRKFPFITILWFDADGVEKIRKGAKDFWDWVTYHFEFKEKDNNAKGVETFTPIPGIDYKSGLTNQRILSLKDKLNELKNKPENERHLNERFTVQKLMGREYAVLRDYENAAGSFETALSLSRKISSSEYESADILINLGDAFEKMGKYESALQFYKDALNLQKKTGDISSGTIYERMGNIFEINGQWRNAIETYQNALIWYNKFESPDSAGEITYRIGRVYEKTGKWSNALDNYRRTMDLYEKAGNEEKSESTRIRINKIMKTRQISNSYNTD